MSSGSERSIYFDAPMYHSHSSDDSGKHDTNTQRPSTSVYQQGRHLAGDTDKGSGNQIEANGKSERRNSKSRNKKPSRTYGPPQPNSPGSANGRGNDRVGGTATETNNPVRLEQVRRTSSFHSLPEFTGDKDRDDKPLAKSKSSGHSGDGIGRKASVRTARTTATTTTAFINGSALAGPNAEPGVDENIYQRGASAERILSKKEKEKIYKEEKRESKRLSRLLKLEAVAERTALNTAICTLASLQEQHKAAIKREAKAEAAHAKAFAAVQKSESKYHEARAQAAEARARAEAHVLEERAKLEGKEAEVKAQEERVESERQIIGEVEQRLAECAREVERLRIIKATDERERRAKIMELNGKTPEE